MDQGPELENFYSNDDADSFQDAARNSEYSNQTSVDVGRTTLSRVDTTSTIHTVGYRNPSSPTDRSRTVSDLSILSPASTVDSSRSSTKRPHPQEYTYSASPGRVDQWQSNFYDPVRSRYFIPPQPQPNRLYLNPNGVAPNNESDELPKLVAAEYRRLADTEAAAIPKDAELLTPQVWKRDFYWPNDYTTTQCACLMRYFIEQLAPWVCMSQKVAHKLTVPV